MNKKNIRCLWVSLFLMVSISTQLNALVRIARPNITFDNQTNKKVNIQLFCGIHPSYRSGCYLGMFTVKPDGSYTLYKSTGQLATPHDLHDIKHMIIYFPTSEALSDGRSGLQSFYFDGSVVSDMIQAIRPDIKAEIKFKITTKDFPLEGTVLWLEKVN